MKSDWAELEIWDWPIRVLHVDSVPECREEMQEILHDQESYELISTDNGYEALDIIGGPSTPPDILITDIKLGETDGYSIVRCTRSWHETAHIPCMVITGNYTSSFIEKMFEFGAEYCLPKPFHPARIEARIVDMVAQHVLPRRKRILAEARGEPPKPRDSETEPMTIGQRLALLDIPPESRIQSGLKENWANLELWDRPVRILHADSHPAIRQDMREILGNRSAYELTSASDGWEAMRALDSGTPPEILITDPKLRELDGIAIAKFLKQDPRTAHVPCMFVTGHYQTWHLRRMFGMGADHCLPKPLNKVDIQAKVLEMVVHDVLPRRRTMLEDAGAISDSNW